MTPAEWKRKAVHAGMGLFALLLRWLTWPEAAACALAALLFNLYAMPRIGRGIYRDPSRPRDTGIVAYAAAVLGLILLFRHDLPVAAALWAMLAFGDPAATIAGKTLGGPALPWNPEKTWTGFLANWAVAGSCAVLFYAATGGVFSPLAGLTLFLAAGVYALCESIRSGLDDNAVAALPTALATVAIAAALAPGRLGGLDLRRIVIALAVNLAVAVIMAAFGVVSRSGALAGGAVGAVIWIFGGWRSYVLLWTFFALGTAATRWGYRRKAAASVAQSDSGRRGPPMSSPTAGSRRPSRFSARRRSRRGRLRGGARRHARNGSRSALRASRVLAGRPRAAAGRHTGRDLVAGHARGAPRRGGGGAVAAALGLVPASRVWVVALAVSRDRSRRASCRISAPGAACASDHEFANAFNTFVGAAAALEIALSLDAGRLYIPFGAYEALRPGSRGPSRCSRRCSASSPAPCAPSARRTTRTRRGASPGPSS